MSDRLLEFLDSLLRGNYGAEDGNCIQLSAPENISTINKHASFPRKWTSIHASGIRNQRLRRGKVLLPLHQQTRFTDHCLKPAILTDPRYADEMFTAEYQW